MADPNSPGDNISSLLRAHDAIHEIYRRAEDALEEEMRGVDWSQMRPEDAKAERDFCEQMRQSIRQAVLIMLYSYLEAGMDLIGKRFVTDYTKKKKAEEKTRDGDFKARLRVFADSDIHLAAAQDGDIAEALRLIRNCLVHAAGRVAQSTERQKLTDAILLLQEDGRKSNCESIEIQEEQIFLHDYVIALANCTSWGLVWDLYNAAMRRGPDNTTV
jgi:hypothetical protein